MERSARHPLPLGYEERPGEPSVGSSTTMHVLALLTCIATFPLIFMGGLVTSHHAGMSVPDWPNSYGYNMFLFPPSHWIGGILYEHTHRLMATVVGMLSILLVLWAWRSVVGRVLQACGRLSGRSVRVPSIFTMREQHRYLALGVLGAVIFQGVLGGLRVVLVQLDLAIVHACVAQAFFCLTAYAALVTSASWHRLPSDGSTKRSGLFYLGTITVAAIYLQLIVGATMRHFDAGLAIPDFSLARFFPPTTAEALQAINHDRAYNLGLDPVTFTQIWLHFAHRIGAVIVSLLVISFAAAAMRRRAAGLVWPAVSLLVLLTAQVTLGIVTVLLRKPADVASSHVAVGALVLTTAFVLTIRAGRLRSQAPISIRGFSTELPGHPALATS